MISEVCPTIGQWQVPCDSKDKNYIGDRFKKLVKNNLRRHKTSILLSCAMGK